MGHFHKRICYDKDNNYKIVSDDLYKNGIFDDNDYEYLVSYVNMRKYPTILFVMAKIMEINNQEQNQIAMYLYKNGKLSKIL